MIVFGMFRIRFSTLHNFWVLIAGGLLLVVMLS